MRRMGPKRRREKTIDGKIKQFVVDGAITEMEAAVAYRTVTAGFTVEDVVDWLWPRRVTETLRAAHPYIYTKTTCHTSAALCLAPPLPMVSLTLELKDYGMVVPADGLLEITSSDTSRNIENAIKEFEYIHRQFNKLRSVVNWLNTYATVGYARFVFPQLGALLPAGHPFHEADGLRYKDPTRDISTIASTLRECGAIIASGLLASPQDVKNERHVFGFAVHPDNQPYSASQKFFIL